MVGQSIVTWRFIAGIFLVVFELTVAWQAARLEAAPIAAPTAGLGAMSVYTVTNANAVAISVEHVFADGAGFHYSFWSQIPAASTVTFHIRDIPEIPSPFNGTLSLYSDQEFTAEIVGYDGAGIPTPQAHRVFIPSVRNQASGGG